MELKQSTASQEILLGPFLDDDDGITQKTGLTIANTDIKLHKAGGTTLGNKNSGGATEIATGFYYAVLDATDTDTLGNLVVVVQITDCLCVRHEFEVVSAAYYEWKYGSTIPKVDVDTIKTQTVTCAAGVTVLASVGTAATSTAQTGDSYAIVNHASYGNAHLVRSTTPDNTLSVDANHLVAVPDTQKVDVNTIKTVAVAATATVTFQNGTIPITTTEMAADVKKINGTTVTGDGDSPPWGPA